MKFRINLCESLLAFTITLASTVTAIASVNMFSAQAQNADHFQSLLEHRTCQRCELSGVKADGANLRESFLDVADLQKSSFIGAILAFSTMYYADFREADLSNSDLRNTFLINGDLIKAIATIRCPTPRIRIFKAPILNLDLAVSLHQLQNPLPIGTI